MIPAQTEVDGALDAAIAAGEMFLSNYWWAIFLFALAYYIRWYAVAKRQGHSTPEIAGAIGVAKHALYTSRTAFVFFVTIAVGVTVELAWGFQIAPTLLGGIFQLNPTVWASVSTAFAAMTTGIYDGLGGFATFSPLELAQLFVFVFLGIIGIRFAGQAAREGLSGDGSDDSSGGESASD